MYDSAFSTLDGKVVLIDHMDKPLLKINMFPFAMDQFTTLSSGI